MQLPPHAFGKLWNPMALEPYQSRHGATKYLGVSIPAYRYSLCESRFPDLLSESMRTLNRCQELEKFS